MSNNRQGRRGRSGQRQTYEVFVVEEGRDGGRNWWNKVGGGFRNQDGSVSLRLHLFPDLLLQVRQYVPKDERPERDERQRGEGGGRRERRESRGEPPDYGPPNGPDRGPPDDDDIPF